MFSNKGKEDEDDGDTDDKKKPQDQVRDVRKEFVSILRTVTRVARHVEVTREALVLFEGVLALVAGSVIIKYPGKHQESSSRLAVCHGFRGSQGRC